MKKYIFNLSMLVAMISYAQEKNDSIKVNDLEGVIINATLKKDSEYVNKMPLKSIENPQLFSTVDKIFFENQMIYSVDDAYRNVTGIQKMWGATNRAGDGGSYISLRGFTSNNSVGDGLVGPVATSIDAVNVEKLEVLRGPSATLYGSNMTSYGGAVNRITKKPFNTFGGSISLIGGSYNYYRAQADVNAPLTNDKKLMFRVNTAYTNTGTFQKTDAKNTYTAFTPSLLYKVNDKLTLSLEFEMFDTKAAPEQSFFYLSKATTGVDNMKDLERLGLDYKQSYYGEGLYTKAEVRNVFGQVNYKINNNIRSSTNISTSSSYSDGYGPYFSITPKSALTLNPADTELLVARADQSTIDSKKTYFQLQQNFNFDYKFGNDMRNRTVVGFDYQKIKDRQMFFYAFSPFDAVPLRGGDYKNMNSNTLANFYANQPAANLGTYEYFGDTNVYSAYIANVFTPIAGLNIMAAIRYENNDYKGGYVWNSSSPLEPYSQSAFSPKAGIVYEIIKDKFSVFGNYQNSFKSNGYYTSDTNNTQTLADPERANQFEGGFKTSLIKGKVNATLSYYNIRVKNTILSTSVPVPSVPFSFVENQAGKMKSEGVELEVNAYLVKGLSLVGGVSYNDSKLLESDASTLGRRPNTAGSPWLASLYASYQIIDGKLKGLGFGLGGNYASANNILNNNIITNNVVVGVDKFTLPEYLILNASAFYDTKKFRIGVKVDNFTNKHYWVGFTTANPQQLINALGSITYKF